VVARSGGHTAQTAQRLDEAAFCGSSQFDHAHGITIGEPIQNSAGVEFKFPAQFLRHNRLAFGCNGARLGKNFQLFPPVFKQKVKRSNYRKASVWETSPTFGVIEFPQYLVAALEVQQFGVVPADAGDFFLDGVAEEIVAVGSQRVHFDEERIGQLDENGFRHGGKIAFLWWFGNFSFCLFRSPFQPGEATFYIFSTTDGYG
jgi:hypothetical protein